MGRHQLLHSMICAQLNKPADAAALLKSLEHETVEVCQLLLLTTTPRHRHARAEQGHARQLHGQRSMPGSRPWTRSRKINSRSCAGTWRLGAGRRSSTWTVG